ncbi:MAG: nucleotidyltransferase substrate binding protein [Thiomicrorhabdus sp.]|nr:nucleotidyltransferase substrate binding protein [Thiomicrorhabdus sp.]
MLDLSSLQKAIQSLKEALLVHQQYATGEDGALGRTLQSGVIQNFEFTYEICWKFLKRWLAENLGKSSVEGLSRRELFRLSVEYRLMDSVETWMIYHRARNETSHTYDQKIAAEVFEVAKGFLSDAECLFSTLQKKS